MSNTTSTSRLDWVDELRGLLIILVVLGHATGKFNAYIYQFHMGAFFVLSGYTENLKGKSLISIVYRKAKRLLLPYITIFITLFPIILIINKFGFYETIFGSAMPEPWFMIREFFLKGSCYIQWLGACWFLPVLFLSTLLAKLMTIISKKYYLVFSFVLYLIAYYFILQENSSRYRDYDLVFVAQFFFSCGFALKDLKIINKIESNRYFKFILFGILLLGTAIMIVNKYMLKYAVDYPSRHFNSFIADALIVFAGFSVLLVIVRAIFDKTVLKRPLIYIGKNTMGIIIFHFLFIKIAIILLYWSGNATMEDVARIVPTEITGNTWWLLITAFSILMSLLVYQGLSFIPGYNMMLGLDKTDKFLPQIESIFLPIINKIKDILNKMKGKMLLRKKQIWKIGLIICFAAILLIVSYFHIIPKIIVNDEVQGRYWYLRGTLDFLRHDASDRIYKEGRVLAALSAPINNFIGYIGTNTELFKVVQWTIVLLNIGLIAFLLFKITRTKQIAILFSLLSILCLPITFEHTAPNAFVSNFGIPLATMTVSFIWYLKYLENKKVRSILLSSFLLFYSLSSYESFLMLTPIFLFLSLSKVNDQTSLWNRVKRAILQLKAPILVSGIYLISYFLLQRLFPSNYAGNSIGFTFKGMLAVISQLFISAIPGYYLINKKYQHLALVYGDGKQIWDNIQPIHFFLFLLLIIIFIIIFRKRKEEKNIKPKYLYLPIISLLSSILVTLPNSIAKMYQGSVNAEQFIALPSSYFVFFLHIITITTIIFALLEKQQGKIIGIIIALAICGIGVLIQTDNRVFALEQIKNYTRMEDIENLIRSDFFKSLDGKTIYAPDLYEQKNTLVIHEGHWTNFAILYGVNAKITGQETKYEATIDFINDEDFVVTDNSKGIKTTIKAKSASKRLSENDEAVINTYEKEGDFYDDGWIGKEGRIYLNTGDIGHVYITLYNAFDSKIGQEGVIHYETEGIKKMMTFKVENNLTTIELEGRPNSKMTIDLDFQSLATKQSNEDARELSLIMHDIRIE